MCSLSGRDRGELVVIELFRDCSASRQPAETHVLAEAQLHRADLHRGASWSLQRWNAQTPGTSVTCAYEVESTSVDASTTLALLTWAVHADTPSA